MIGPWKTKLLGEVVMLQRGFDLPIQDRQPGTVPVVSSSGVSGSHSEARSRAPGVVTGRYGTIGEVHFIREDFWPLNTTLFVKDFKGNDERFVYYLLSSLDFSSFSDKSSVPGVNRNHLHGMPVRVPATIKDQRRIAAILGALDDKIELNHQMSQTLEAIARTLFKSWFVDFDPVHAKAAGRQPAGMDAKTAELFPSEFEESELGLIPKGWRTDTLMSLASLNPENWTRNAYPNNITYVDLTGTKWGRIESITEYAREDAPSRAQRILRPGDTIVGTVRPGNGAYALVAEAGLTGSTGFAVLRPNFSEASEFTYLAATSGSNIQRLTQLADGGAYPAVRPDVVSATSIALPPQEIVGVFSRASNPLLSRIAANGTQSKTLVAIRDSLLPQLLSGTIRLGSGTTDQEALL